MPDTKFAAGMDAQAVETGFVDLGEVRRIYDYLYADARLRCRFLYEIDEQALFERAFQMVASTPAVKEEA